MVPAIFFCRYTRRQMRFLSILFCIFLLHAQQKIHPGLGRGWSGEFDLAANQLVALAEATPADKFTFRPAPGVRSTSELYMHVAVGNFWLLAQAGIKPGGKHWPPEVPAGVETKTIAKAEVLRWLKDSMDAVRAAQPTADPSKKVQFLGAEVPASQVLLRLLVHNHEHMGQAIAYARMSGVTPPWSSEASTR
jgi:uncharacterized damage-inducible protein DinB